MGHPIKTVHQISVDEALGKVVFCDESEPADVGRFSGDDAYDLAAGGNPDGDLLALACIQTSGDSWPGWDGNNSGVVIVG